MKIHYLQKSRNSVWVKYRLVVAFLVICLAFYYAGGFLFPNFTSKVFRFVGTPFWQARSYVTKNIALRLDLLHSKGWLAANNRELRDELEQVKASLAEAEALGKMYEHLAPPTHAKVIEAKVLVRPPQTAYDTFVLAVGTEDGLSVGDMVLYNNAVRIGEITRVSGHTAEAVLYSTAGRQFQALLGASGEFSVEGKGGGTYEIKVPRDVVVKVGDPLMSTEKHAMLYGTVEHIDDEGNDPFKNIFLRVPVNLNSLMWVEVVPTPKDSRE